MPLLDIDTPAQTTPGAPITVTGIYDGDPPTLQYDLGAGWFAAPQPGFDAGTFSFTLPDGVPAGTYTPQIRDQAAPGVVLVGGAFVVGAWTPQTLATSPGAAAVFEFDANDPGIVPGSPNSAVSRVLNSLDRTQSLTAQVGSGGNPVQVVDDSGADGQRRVLQFNPATLNSNLYDPSTNWLSAGGVGGSAGAALVSLADSTDLSTSGSFTTIIALDLEASNGYVAGPIWGTLASPGPLQYAQLRINRGSGAEGANLASSDQPPINAQGPIVNGWHVLTMIKNAGLLTYRLDGQVVQASRINSADAFTASDFLIGGGFPQGSTANLGQENGVPPPDIGEFQAYRGALAGTDLVNAEALAGNTIGVTMPQAPASPAMVTLGSTPVLYAAHGGDTVHGGSGPATITASAGPVLVLAGSGPLQFVGGTASSTVSGGSGATTLFGGSGGGRFGAGSAGGSVLVASGGNTTLTGGGVGDRLFGAAAGQTVMIAGGRESLVGGTASTTIIGGANAGAVVFTGGDTTMTGGAAGGDTVIGGAGALSMTMHDDALFAGAGTTSVDGATSGADSIIGGGGTLRVTGHGANMLVAAGSASSSIVTGNGASLVFSGSGSATIQEGAGAAVVVLGSGVARITEGGGAVTYDLVRGSAGGIDVIAGFRPGTDHIALFGYGDAVARVDPVGGNDIISLSDGSRITLLNVADAGVLAA